MAQNDVITAIAQAIIRQENVNPVYNNPGAIFDVKANKLRTYSTYEEGYQALINQVRLNVSRGLTLEEFFGGKPGVYPGYAPVAPGVHSTNNPNKYASNVSSWTGIPLGVPIKDVYSIGVPAQSTNVGSNPTGQVTPTTVDPIIQTPSINLLKLTDFTGAWVQGVEDSEKLSILALAVAAVVGLYFVMR